MGPVKPGPNQESVWDYPRPPALVNTDEHLKVMFNNQIIAETRNGKRVLETSQPPAYYFPPDDVNQQWLSPLKEFTYCEWKGHAYYFNISVADKTAKKAAWHYPDPNKKYRTIKNYIAFYAHKLDCFVNGEPVQAQEGRFYGGWITDKVVGPFKGGTGTAGW